MVSLPTPLKLVALAVGFGVATWSAGMLATLDGPDAAVGPLARRDAQASVEGYRPRVPALTPRGVMAVPADSLAADLFAASGTPDPAVIGPGRVLATGTSTRVVLSGVAVTASPNDGAVLPASSPPVVAVASPGTSAPTTTTPVPPTTTPVPPVTAGSVPTTTQPSTTTTHPQVTTTTTRPVTTTTTRPRVTTTTTRPRVTTTTTRPRVTTTATRSHSRAGAGRTEA